ncbi:MAG: DUF2304 domain-containing protein [Deltaproteobacteria bacterium]|nr:DUF2304 domain-containing protein [Deltaproteobacteria bacterium]
MIRIQLLSLVLSLGLLAFVVEMVRREKLLEQYSLLWIFGSVVLLALSASPRLLDRVAPVLGIAYPPAALFLGGIFLLVLLALHFSLVVSKLSKQTRILAQKLARLEEERKDRRPDA